MSQGQPVALPIQLHPANLRPLAFRIFSKKHALNIKTDALAALSEFIGLRFGNEWRGIAAQQYMEEIAKLWKAQERGLFLDGVGVKEVIAELQALERRTVAASDTHNSAINDNHSEGVKARGGIESLIRRKEKTPEQMDLTKEQSPESLDVEVEEQEEQKTTTTTTTTNSISWRDHFQVINATDQPRFNYDHVAKRYDLIKNETGSRSGLLSSLDVQDNINLFLQRFHIIKDRVLRHENFQISNPLSSFTGQSSSPVAERKITLIKNLLGRNNQQFFLFGMLVIKQGELYLEDSSDSIVLKFTQKPEIDDCYFTEGSFVLAEGIFNKGVFFCIGIHAPFAERRALTLEANHNFDFLNTAGNFRVDIEMKRRLRELETQLQHQLVFLGVDCHLDDPKTMEGLKKFFSEITDAANYDTLPIAIVFQGSFTSTLKHSAEYKALFNSLATLLESFPLVTNNVHLIFIPGPNDLWATSVWPKQPIPKVFTSRIDRLCKYVTWASNPTRLVYLSREIVIFRDDLSGCFKRNNIDFEMEATKKFSNEEEEEQNSDEEAAEVEQTQRSEIDRLNDLPQRIQFSRKLIRTLLTQTHLSPFPRQLRSVVWTQDHTLRLSPIPNLLVIGDASCGDFMVNYHGCSGVNPGKLIHKRRLNLVRWNMGTNKGERSEVYF